jgi:hypothetical protein
MPVKGDRIPMDERFWAKVHVRSESECWEFLGNRSSQGYGRIAKPGHQAGYIAAHRYSAMLAFGMFDTRLWVLHRCDNPPCVNPSHLFLGDRTDNIRDMVAKGRHHAQKSDRCIRGHLLEGDNLIHWPSRSGRVCRECRRLHWTRHNQRVREVTP